MTVQGKRGKYHHGDLRRALLDAALEILAEEGGAAGLTLREVARRAGVTHAAPYRHFADKAALLAAVAEEGFRAIYAEMLARSGHCKDPVERLFQIGVAYVLFAVTHPAHFRVMFGPEIVSPSPYASLVEAGNATFQLLLDSITECQKAGRFREGPTEELAYSQWAWVHGLASLYIDKQLRSGPPDLAGLEALTLRIGSSFYEGLAIVKPLP
jgi:AcrR family transcriptional regulator